MLNYYTIACYLIQLYDSANFCFSIMDAETYMNSFDKIMNIKKNIDKHFSTYAFQSQYLLFLCWSIS